MESSVFLDACVKDPILWNTEQTGAIFERMSILNLEKSNLRRTPLPDPACTPEATTEMGDILTDDLAGALFLFPREYFLIIGAGPSIMRIFRSKKGFVEKYKNGGNVVCSAVFCEGDPYLTTFSYIEVPAVTLHLRVLKEK